MRTNKAISMAVLIAVSLLAPSSNSANARELCVGAIGRQLAGYCSYEFEAYVTTGSCRRRNGQWDPTFTLTLYLRSPARETVGPRQQYVNKNGWETGLCKRACADAIATGPTRLSKPVCNRRSHELRVVRQRRG